MKTYHEILCLEVHMHAYHAVGTEAQDTMHTSRVPSSRDTVACTITLILLLVASTEVGGPTGDMRSSATSGSAHPHHPTHTVSLLPSTSLERSISMRRRGRSSSSGVHSYYGCSLCIVVRGALGCRYRYWPHLLYMQYGQP